MGLTPDPLVGVGGSDTTLPARLLRLRLLRLRTRPVMPPLPLPMLVLVLVPRLPLLAPSATLLAVLVLAVLMLEALPSSWPGALKCDCDRALGVGDMGGPSVRQLIQASPLAVKLGSSRFSSSLAFFTNCVRCAWVQACMRVNVSPVGSGGLHGLGPSVPCPCPLTCCGVFFLGFCWKEGSLLKLGIWNLEPRLPASIGIVEEETRVGAYCVSLCLCCLG